MIKKTLNTNQKHPAIVEYRKAMEKGKEKIKLYNIKAFKEAIYGEDLTKLTKFLNEEDRGEL